jgi:Flp pilus assembly protein TadG
MKSPGPFRKAVARLVKSLWRNSDGTALVEGALVVPIVLSIALGVYEFSWYFYQEHLISMGLRDAARYVGRSVTPTDAKIQADAKNLATMGAIAGGTPRVAGWAGADVTISFTGVTGTYRGGPMVSLVRVSTSFRDPSLGFFGFFGLTAPLISVSHQERVIGST